MVASEARGGPPGTGAPPLNRLAGHQAWPGETTSTLPSPWQPTGLVQGSQPTGSSASPPLWEDERLPGSTDQSEEVGGGLVPLPLCLGTVETLDSWDGPPVFQFQPHPSRNTGISSR